MLGSAVRLRRFQTWISVVQSSKFDLVINAETDCAQQSCIKG
jgi:hypothetical protein